MVTARRWASGGRLYLGGPKFGCGCSPHHSGPKSVGAAAPPLASGTSWCQRGSVCRRSEVGYGSPDRVPSGSPALGDGAYGQRRTAPLRKGASTSPWSWFWVSQPCSIGEAVRRGPTGYEVAQSHSRLSLPTQVHQPKSANPPPDHPCRFSHSRLHQEAPVAGACVLARADAA